MPWIREEEAGVGGIIKIMSINPGAMRQFATRTRQSPLAAPP